MFETIKPETDPVATILNGLDALSCEDRDHWPATARSERLVELIEVQERLASVTARVAGTWDRQQAWKIDGALSGPGWLTRNAPISKTKARRLVAAGRMTVDHPVVEEALVAGEVTVDHVEVLARVAAVKHRAELVGDHIEMLIDSAVGLAVDDFSIAANTWGFHADDQVTDRSFMEQHQRRGLYLAATFDGVVAIDGLLDPVGDATVITALEHLAPPDPTDSPDGARSPAQRRADALVELAETYLSGTNRKAASVTLNAVIDVARMTGDTPDPVIARCDVDRVGPVSRSSMERLGCGAELTRVVMDGPSLVLDLGRSARLATPAQRKALTVRDRGCVFEGCGRPARWCDIHHLTSWLLGGLTNLDDLVLVCRRHHVLCHEGGWRLQRQPDGAIETIRPNLTPVARPP